MIVKSAITLLEHSVDALNRGVSSVAALLLIGAAVVGWLQYDKLSDDAMLGIAGAAIGYLFGNLRRGQPPTNGGPPAPPTPSA